MFYVIEKYLEFKVKLSRTVSTPYPSSERKNTLTLFEQFLNLADDMGTAQPCEVRASLLQLLLASAL